MSGKTLSTGTLSLRFMQNAQKQKKVQLDKAEVRDDAAWEVPKAVRDAWDEKAPPTQDITHETSYLPFLFPSLANAEFEEGSSSSVPKVKGRRVFKKGQEVESVSSVPNGEAASSISPPSKDSATPKPEIIPSKGNAAGRPIARARPSQRSEPKVSAQEAIRNISGVGVDLRAARRAATVRDEVSTPPRAPSPPKTFIKPSGVDEPSRPNLPTKGTRKDEIIQQARKDVKSKRERESSEPRNTPDTEEPAKKRRKKKKNAVATVSE